MRSDNLIFIEVHKLKINMDHLHMHMHEVIVCWSFHQQRSRPNTCIFWLVSPCTCVVVGVSVYFPKLGAPAWTPDETLDARGGLANRTEVMHILHCGLGGGANLQRRCWF